MKKLVIIMAPPGAGKSELANYIHQNHANSIIVNKNNFTKGDLYTSELIYYQTINRLLKEQDYVILDSQTVLYQDRAELFSHLNLNEVKVIGVWVETSRREADYRNSQKPKDERPTEKEMDFYFKYKMSPMPEEPFDDLIYIMRDANVGMSKSYPYLGSTLETLDRV